MSGNDPLFTKRIPNRSGSDEDRAYRREAALARWRRDRGKGRHPNTVAPVLTKAPRTASQDTQVYSNRPGPTRLHDGPTMAELTAQARDRRRRSA